MKKIISIISLMFILTACSSGSNESDGISGFFGKEPVKDVKMQAYTLEGEKLGEPIVTGADGSFSLASIDQSKPFMLRVIDNSVKAENFIGAVALDGEATFDARMTNLVASMNSWEIFVSPHTRVLFTPLAVAATKSATGATNVEKAENFKYVYEGLVSNLSSLILNLDSKYALSKDEMLNGSYNPNLEFALQILDLAYGGRTGTYDNNYFTALAKISVSGAGLKEINQALDLPKLILDAKTLTENVAKEMEQALIENTPEKITQLGNTIVLSTIVNPEGVSAYKFSEDSSAFLFASYRDIVVPLDATKSYQYSASVEGFKAKDFAQLEEALLRGIELKCEDDAGPSSNDQAECDEINELRFSITNFPTSIDRIVITEANTGLSYDLPITKDEFLSYSKAEYEKDNEDDDYLDFLKMLANTTTNPFFRLKIQPTDKPIEYFVDVTSDFSGQKVHSSMKVRTGAELTRHSDTGCGGFEGVTSPLCD